MLIIYLSIFINMFLKHKMLNGHRKVKFKRSPDLDSACREDAMIEIYQDKETYMIMIKLKF